MTSKRITIKYGGNAIEDNQSILKFAETISKLRKQYPEIIICHGGGPQINQWLEKTKITSHFIDGQRYTDKATLDVVEMALVAHVNKALIRALQSFNIKAIGLSGEDANLLTAEISETLGWVGTIKNTNAEIINILLQQGYLPVIAPLACDPSYKTALNINADYAAAHIAAASQSPECIFMTNVDGLLNAEKRKIDHASQSMIENLIKDGTISGGMIPKVDCALTALKLGVKSTRIINGKNPEILLGLAKENNLGTVISV